MYSMIGNSMHKRFQCNTAVNIFHEHEGVSMFQPKEHVKLSLKSF